MRDSNPMQTYELIRQIRDLGVYSDAEWTDFINCYDNPTLSDYLASHPPAGLGDLGRRILQGVGAESAAADLTQPKIATIKQLCAVRSRAVGKIGVVSGCYDLLHLGHLRGIGFARHYVNTHGGGTLFALLLSDENIRVKKGPTRPVLNLSERLAMVAAARAVDFAVPLLDSNCLTALGVLKPDHFFKLPHDQDSPIVRQEIGLVVKLGGYVTWFPEGESEGRSTTRFIEEVRSKFAASNRGVLA